MAINFGLAGGGFNALETLQAYGAAADRKARDDALANRRQIGAIAASGDFAGAKRAAAASGDFDLTQAIGGLEQDHLQRLNREFDSIGQLHPTLKALPVEQRAAVAIPLLKQAGFGDQELAGVDWSDASIDGIYAMSQQGKTALAARMKAMEPRVLNDGDQLFVNGQMVAENPREEKPIWDSEGGNLIYPSQFGGASQPASGTGPSADAVWQSIIQQESGGKPGVVGPETRYGRAVGMTQMLPATAREMASKLGVPWRRDLLGAASAEGAAYQEMLGRAYFDQGLEKNGGDLERAAMYYHGGPDTRLWGPKTRAYSQSVLGRANVAPQPQQGRQPGVVNVRAPKRKDAPSGYEWSGDGLRPIRGGPADPKTATSRNVQSDRKAEADFRKEFNNSPQAKKFIEGRSQFQTLKNLASQEPNAQRDMAAIFTFMKTLDPTSTVREGEYASAKNAAGIPDRLRNAYNSAKDGQLLTPRQRLQMVEAAFDAYVPMREAYNSTLTQYRGYAQDYGLNPDRVGRRYVPDSNISQDRLRQFKVIR